MQKGFILPIIFLLLLIFGGYMLFNRLATYPNSVTQQTAANISKYPNAISWEIKNQKNVCLIPNQECTQPSYIYFNSEDSWNAIYFFYKDLMTKKGWNTKSTIITSVPTDITFTSGNGCRIILNQFKPLIKLSKNEFYQYNFSITCP